MAIALPRFLFMGLSISQTYLINNAVGFIQSANSPSDSVNTGYGLIGAFQAASSLVARLPLFGISQRIVLVAPTRESARGATR